MAYWRADGTFTVGGIVGGNARSIQITASAALLMPNNSGTTWLTYIKQ